MGATSWQVREKSGVVAVKHGTIIKMPSPFTLIKRYYFRLRYEYVFAAIKGENPVRLESKRGFLGGDIDKPG